MFKRKQRKTKVSWVAILGICTLLVGVALDKTPLVEKLTQLFERLSVSAEQPQTQLRLTAWTQTTSQVLPLVRRSPQSRRSTLEAIAASQEQSLDRNRARYLLSSDYLEQQQGERALAWLEKLEYDYPVLASHIILKRARAYETIGDNAKAESTWKHLWRRYAKDPVAAEALFQLGKTNPQYWEKAIEKFPAHPRTVEIAQLQLNRKQRPNQQLLLLLLAKHGHYLADYTKILDRLTSNHQQHLKPEDWEQIAFGYWEKQEYGKAGAAYAKAPPTPRNTYRAARGLQIGGKKELARLYYKKLFNEFPDARENARGLIHLATLSELKYAADYLDTVISKFPDKAAAALLEKSKVLDSLQSAKSAYQARESILSQYSQSEVAAELRWELAQKRAKTGDLQAAWQWAQQLTVENPDSDLAPEAAFWVGKWAQRLGREADAKTAFNYVLKTYPESYYAWRSAVLLGWNVGDFTTVRQMTPQVQPLSVRPLLPTGSDTLKELYLLGQDRAAWTLWQVEFVNPMEPAVAEQFTDGLLRLGVGDYLEGIFMINSLKWREDPQERSQYEILRNQPAYWHALYPFPYEEAIEKWSENRQLNPLLVIALIRQESRFIADIRSVVGATGLMQIMPETGTWIASELNLKEYQLENPNDNIKMGTWYLDFTHWKYNNNSLLAVASYNAGPGNVSQWINRYGFQDPDEFVELIPFAETEGYIAGVFGNYWNYLRLYNPQISQRLAHTSKSNR